jgi:hypothetical protein
VELAEKHRKEYGVNRCLRALKLSKGTWHRRRDRALDELGFSLRQHRPAAPEEDRELKAHVLAVVEDHPAYGYRRIGVELRERTGERVNHKRLRRLLNAWDLALRCQVARPWPSEGRRSSTRGQGSSTW